MAECLHQHISEFDNEQFCRTCSRAAADLVIELSEQVRQERHATAQLRQQFADAIRTEFGLTEGG